MRLNFHVRRSGKLFHIAGQQKNPGEIMSGAPYFATVRMPPLKSRRKRRYGSRAGLLASGSSRPPSLPVMSDSGVDSAAVAGYSGGSAADFHRFPTFRIGTFPCTSSKYGNVSVETRKNFRCQSAHHHFSRKREHLEQRFFLMLRTIENVHRTFFI